MWRINPRGGGETRGFRGPADEALGMAGIGGVEHVSARGVDGVGLVVVNHFRGEQSQARVPVLGVVPGKEVLAERTCLLDAVEASGKVRAVLERLELGFGVGIVVGDVWP